MTALACAVEVPVSSTPGADARSWPLEAGYWSTCKPVGGFALLSVEQLLLPWQAHQQGLIEPLALRGSLASRDMRERRCAMPPGTPTHYRAHELQALLGPAVRRSQAEKVIESLATIGLVTWTAPSIRLITHPEDLQGLDQARSAALRAHVHPLLYRVPVPRRMLRYLAREGSPGLIATTLGVVLRCLRYYRRDKACRSGGTISAAWLADCFGLAERTAYRSLATLAALGWLATVPPPPEFRHLDGPWRVVNLAWDLPPAERLPARAAPRQRRPVQLALFPLAGIAANDTRPPGSAQAPGGDTPAPEDAAASAPPAGVTDSPEPPAGEEAPAASTPDAAAIRALIAASLQEAAAPRASHAGEPEDLEARYAVLPATDQEALWAQARAHLMQQGTPPAFLITPVVLAEVCRRLAQPGGPDAPEAVPHAVEAAPAGADGCKNLAVDNRHDGKNLAVPLKDGSFAHFHLRAGQ